VALPAMNQPTFQAIDQQQLRNTGLNVLNSILLGVGSPANWGSAPSTAVEEFGLARSSPFSKYILDTDKVQRIDPEGPWSLTYEQVKDLLKLQGYEFNLTFYRPFTTIPLVDIDFDTNLTRFGVDVFRTQDGAPIPNAEINVTIFMSSLSGEATYSIGPFTTDTAGHWDYDMYFGSGVLTLIAIMQVTVGGMSTIVVSQDGYVDLSEFISIYTSGDIVRLMLRQDEMQREVGIPPSTRYITNAWVYVNGERLNIFEGREKITWGEGYEFIEILFDGLSELDATAVIIRLEINIPGSADIDVPDFIKEKGRVPVYVVGALSFGNFDEILGFGYELPPESTIATIRRIVVVSDMTYIAELALWKE
jgi:hypothetical protein